MSGYPIQPGKAQPPALREETLARHRLLDWLDVKIHNRVVFVIADAGYGKTTLLADFTRRSRLRTLWYRMDEEDRNWVAFLSYLVAAGRVHDPDFAPRTYDLLQDTGPGGATLDDALTAFLRELPTIAQDGAVLILDDFHVAEDVPDIVTVARQLVAHAPERLTLVFSSRRVPPLPVARLRALGEVAELRTSDLRFSDAETEALFKDTYGRALEPDVLSDLSRRTDGWAASLYLVRAALRDRSAADTRAFVRGLTGAQTELHDYLAEEVIGDLAPEQQAFLMKASILQSVHPDQAAVASGLSTSAVVAKISDAERLGLLVRRLGSDKMGHSFHPLVRQFLEARLRREVGDERVDDLHRGIAEWASARDWRTAAYHFSAASETERLHDVIDRFIETIVGSGDIAEAAAYLDRFPPRQAAASFEIVLSRQAGLAMDIDGALSHARRAVELAPEWDVSLGSLLATYLLAGDHRPSLALAEQLVAHARTPIQRLIGAASTQVIGASQRGNLEEAVSLMRQVADESRLLGLSHFEGVALLNSAILLRAQGDAHAALAQAAEASEVLSLSSAGSEVVAAQLAQAWAMAHLGDLDGSRTMLAASQERCTSASRVEWATEAAEIEMSYGSEEVAAALLEEATSVQWNPSFASMNALTRVQLALRSGNLVEAAQALPEREPSLPALESGFFARHLAVAAHVALRAGDATAKELIGHALSIARDQRAWHWAEYTQTLNVVRGPGLDRGIRRLERANPVYISLLAELFLDRLGEMSDESAAAINTEAIKRSERWKPSLRRVVDDSTHPSRLRAARILDQIGDRSDVPRLRAIARGSKGPRTDTALGRSLARRLADPVVIEDLGRVEVRVGSQTTSGSEVRRKVLSMLCYLLTKPRFSATREEVVDALWPDLAPDVAVNSLNQTVYFLRRVFEPKYTDSTTAGYVWHDSDVLWLDPDLIHSRSQLCLRLIDGMRAEGDPTDVERLSQTYTGRFALDFAYEDWAVPFRESLHASYLQVVESAVSRDIETGHHERGIRLARRALQVDPVLDGVELSLVRMYRATGAHAAAAEQYAHYSEYMREELGVEPPTLESI